MIPTSGPLGLVLGKLSGVKRSGGGYIAKCPGHDDRTASLSITVGDMQPVLLHCHAGCSTEKITAAMGLRPADLCAPNLDRARPGRASNGSTLEAEYDYVDEAGTLLYQVLRYHPKAFKQRRPGLDGGWIYNMDGVQRVLFHLPEILKAAAAHRTVILCEGEKDTGALERLGLTATTKAGGAKSPWLPAYTEALRGASHVVVLADNDAAGCAAAGEAADQLLPVARSVRQLVLPGVPAGGDSSDWIAAGGDVAQLQAIVKGTPKHELGVRLKPTGTQPTEEGPSEGPSVQSAVSVTDSAAVEWSEPAPLPTIAPVPPFDSILLPETLRPWCDDIADRMQCPLEFVAISAVVALASLVARRWAIRPKAADDWTVVPNLWGAIIARPGALKTPAIREALRPLRRLQQEAAAAHEDAMQLWGAQQVVAKAEGDVRRKQLGQRLAKGDDRQELARELRAQPAADRPPCRRYVVNDFTVEALGEILRDNPGGTLVFRDELTGLFTGMDKPDRGDARAFLLEGWTGGDPFDSDRIGRGTIRIPDLTISLLGGIQPGPFQTYFREATAQQGADGFLQRLQLVVSPDLSPTFRNVDRTPDASAATMADDTFRRIVACDPTSGNVQRGLVHFAPDAQATFNEWLEALETRLRAGGEHHAFESHLSKYRSLLPSLALIFHVADNRSAPVALDTTLRALAWLEYLEPHARRVYAPVLSRDASAAQLLAKRLESGDLVGPFTSRTVYRKQWAGLGQAEVHEALELLEDYGWVRRRQVATGGRVREEYDVNPGLRGRTS